MKTFLRRLRALFRKEKLDAEMSEEMRAHLELQAAENERRGMAPDAARHAAQRQFGGVEQVKESARDARGFVWVGHLAQDLRYAARMLRKNPGYAAVAALTLALGVGLNTAILNVLDQLVVRPLRVAEPQSLASVFGKDRRSPANSWATTRATMPYIDYAFYRDHTTSFSGLAGALLTPVTLAASADAPGNAGGSVPEERQIFAQLVSGNYFSVLGGRTVLGRSFRPDEDQVPGAHPVVVLSHRFWQRHFESDAGVVGASLKLNGHVFTIIGVAAPDFGGNRATEPAVWIPMMMAVQIRPGTNLAAKAGNYVDVVGRLKPGVTLAQAQAEMDVVAQQNLAAHPDSNMLGVRVALLAAPDALSGWALAVALVVMLLLVVAANVANLSLARSVGRQREIGLRLALGASRGRLIRQLLTESALLGLIGGLIGLFVSGAATRIILLLLQQQAGGLLIVDFVPEIGFWPNRAVFGFALGISLLVGILVGLAPALQATRLDLSSALKDEGTIFGRRISRSRLRNGLVVVQVALSLVLLVGAGLLVRGWQRAQSIDPGFAIDRVLVVRTDLRAQGYNAVRRTEFYRSFAGRARLLPGVKSVAFATDVPLQGGLQTGPASPSAATPARQVPANFVSPEFFATLGIPLVAGRNFRDDETRQAAPVAIVNEALAHTLWPGEDPVGKQIHGFFNLPAEVIGVVRNAHDVQLGHEAGPCMYFLDRPGVKGGRGGNDRNLSILIRTERSPREAVAAVRAAVRALDRELWPVIRTLEGNLALQLAPSRLGAWLTSALGVLALIVTAIGLYGVIAYTTAQRTREIGVRMALGARPRDVLGLVLGQGWRLVGLGELVGLAGAMALGRVLAQFLYGLSPLDPVAFGGVALVLGAVALLACWLPARRAMQVDPAVALRCE